MPALNMPNRVDQAETLYPHRPIPDGQDVNAAINISTQQHLAASIGVQDAHTNAVAERDASANLTALHNALRGIAAPHYDTLDILINYGEIVEEQHAFNRGWVLSAITLLPGVQSSGTIHNPNVCFIDGLPRTRGGGGFGNSSRLAIPFALVSTDTYLEIPIEGRLYLHFSVQAASPGAMMVMPRAILRFENWENGMPLEGGNQ